jgi:NTP pyrophosphatase (non-canonical NTP hydrolase)
MKKIIKEVIRWGAKKGITDPKNTFQQLAKVTEELGQLNGAILKGTREEQVKEFGDTLVTLVLLSAQLNLSFAACLEAAHKKNISRKPGKMINGTYVKGDDLHKKEHPKRITLEEYKKINNIID